MKRWLWVAIGAVVLGSAAIGLVAFGRRPDFTTSSPEALAEFDLALNARMKLYAAETERHLERAVALDPDFVIAKLMLADHLYGDEEKLARRKRLLEEVAAADLSRLTPRERFLVQRAFAVRGGRPDEATKLTAEYLGDNPDDPWVLNISATEAWARGDMAEAERLNRRLIEVSPNWVIAYNMLGYGAMDQGKFAEAEEHFTSYRFIAPDQANPHDSLAELFLLVGRYDEAVESLERAIDIRPDFWASYEHLFMVHLLRRDLTAARAAIDRAAAAEAPPDLVAALDCVLRLARLEAERAWQALLDEATSRCQSMDEGGDERLRETHLALCKLGRVDDAKGVEDELRAMLEKWAGGGKRGEATIAGQFLLVHLEGVRLALAGDLEGAAARLRDADRAATYRNAPLGLLKLANQLTLVEVLQASGQGPEADRVLNLVRAVNAPLVNDFEAGRRRLLAP